MPQCCYRLFETKTNKKDSLFYEGCLFYFKINGINQGCAEGKRNKYRIDNRLFCIPAGYRH